MESIFATSKQYRCIIISPKSLFYDTLRVKIEKSPLKKSKQDNCQHNNHSCLVAGSDFPSFLFFSLSSIFLPFLLILSSHLSFFLFFSFMLLLLLLL